MKIWLLEPNDDVHPGERGEDPWEPWHYKVFAFVVAAPDEETARQVAQNRGAEECRGPNGRGFTTPTDTPWIEPEYTTCTELVGGDYEEATVIVRDFASA